MSDTLFPATREEALAMQFLRAQDLSGKTPEEINTMYWETVYAIQRDDEEKGKSGWFRVNDPKRKKEEKEFW